MRTHDCEICGEPATCAVCDLQELAPIFHSGQWWQRYSQLEHHWYCAGHTRPSETFPLVTVVE